MKTRTEYVEGLRELDEALAQLPTATSRNVLKRTLLSAAEPIRAYAQTRAPRRTGLLANSITKGRALTRRQKVIHKKWAAQLNTGTTPMGPKTVWVFVGPGPFGHSHLQEFGTRAAAAHPYMRPAWDSQQERAFNIVKAVLWAEIKSAADRLARKAQRIALKMKTGR